MAIALPWMEVNFRLNEQKAANAPRYLPDHLYRRPPTKLEYIDVDREIISSKFGWISAIGVDTDKFYRVLLWLYSSSTFQVLSILMGAFYLVIGFFYLNNSNLRNQTFELLTNFLDQNSLVLGGWRGIIFASIFVAGNFALEIAAWNETSRMMVPILSILPVANACLVLDVVYQLIYFAVDQNWGDTHILFAMYGIIIAANSFYFFFVLLYYNMMILERTQQRDMV